MIIAYDADWQFPAITEEHAYRQAVRYLPESDSAVYIGFPWATLFDAEARSVVHFGHLKHELVQLKSQIPSGRRVVTVCQHIDLRKHLHFLIELGITDVFWSHATTKGDLLPGTEIQSWPFPLYPVQQIQPQFWSERDIAFSFVGATSNQWYLTQSRAWIGELLDDIPSSVVALRDKWHFNKVVYDHQIHAKEDGKSKPWTDEAASAEYIDVLARSRFALCPSGTGPNSIRLWECVHAGIIPVVLSDTYVPPGDSNLWREAVVVCREHREAIAALPKQLEALAADEDAINRMLHALAQIRFIYGIEYFIYDLVAFFTNPATWKPVESEQEVLVAPPVFYSMSSFEIPGFLSHQNTERRLYFQSLVTSLLLKPEATVEHLQSIETSKLHDEAEVFLKELPPDESKVYLRVLSPLLELKDEWKVK